MGYSKRLRLLDIRDLVWTEVKLVKGEDSSKLVVLRNELSYACVKWIKK